MQHLPQVIRFASRAERGEVQSFVRNGVRKVRRRDVDLKLKRGGGERKEVHPLRRLPGVAHHPGRVQARDGLPAVLAELGDLVLQAGQLRDVRDDPRFKQRVLELDESHRLRQHSRRRAIRVEPVRDVRENRARW